MTQPRQPQWVPYLALAVATCGFIFQGGVLYSRVDSNTQRIVKLEAADQARSDMLNAVNVRTARIETKLDMLVSPEKFK